MARRKLSAVAIPTLPVGAYPDHIVPGLTLRVGANRRTWTYRYRSGGKNPRVGLGHYPRMGLAEARDAARKTAERIDNGAPAPAPTPHPRSSLALTLGALIDRYETMRTREGTRIKSLSESMRALRAGLRPWLAMPAAGFSKADLRAARDAITERGITAANRLLAYFGPVMRWAAQEELVPVNFVPDLRRAPEGKRSRVLSDKEIAAIWAACDKLGDGPVSRAFGRLVRFLLVTAQRRGEAASLKNGDVVDGVWQQRTNKADRPLELILPPMALALIGQGNDPDMFVFGGMNGQIRGWSKLKRKLDKVSGTSGWRLHDLRRSAASRMQTLGVRNDIVQAVLNHAVPGVGQVYLRAELEDQKAAALASWATALTRVVQPMHVVA